VRGLEQAGHLLGGGGLAAVDVVVARRERCLQRQQLTGRLGARRVVRHDAAGLREGEVPADGLNVDRAGLRGSPPGFPPAVRRRRHDGSLRLRALTSSGHMNGPSGWRAVSRSTAARVAAASSSVVMPWASATGSTLRKTCATIGAPMAIESR